MVNSKRERNPHCGLLCSVNIENKQPNSPNEHASFKNTVETLNQAWVKVLFIERADSVLLN